MCIVLFFVDDFNQLQRLLIIFFRSVKYYRTIKIVKYFFFNLFSLFYGNNLFYSVYEFDFQEKGRDRFYSSEWNRKRGFHTVIVGIYFAILLFFENWKSSFSSTVWVQFLLSILPSSIIRYSMIHYFFLMNMVYRVFYWLINWYDMIGYDIIWYDILWLIRTNVSYISYAL